MHFLENILACCALLVFGFVWGVVAGRLDERQKLRLDRGRLELEALELDRAKREHKAKVNEHEHIGTVVRCTPFAQVERIGESGVARTVEGTNVLMRCECGLFWLRWFPGDWTPDDFTRTKPLDMDKVVRDLTTPNEGGNTP